MQTTANQDRWLSRIGVASPCDQSWDSMNGDERIRACERCEMNVYNLSGMTRDEAETLVKGAEGRVCVRFVRRTDGTVLTKDCPAGLAAVRRKMALVATAVVGLLVGIVGWAAAAWSGANGDRGWNATDGWTGDLPKPIAKVFKPFDAPPERMVMGEMCIMPAPTPQPPAQPLVPIKIDTAAHE